MTTTTTPTPDECTRFAEWDAPDGHARLRLTLTRHQVFYRGWFHHDSVDGWRMIDSADLFRANDFAAAIRIAERDYMAM